MNKLLGRLLVWVASKISSAADEIKTLRMRDAWQDMAEADQKFYEKRAAGFLNAWLTKDDRGYEGSLMAEDLAQLIADHATAKVHKRDEQWRYYCKCDAVDAMEKEEGA